MRLRAQSRRIELGLKGALLVHTVFSLANETINSAMQGRGRRNICRDNVRIQVLVKYALKGALSTPLVLRSTVDLAVDV